MTDYRAGSAKFNAALWIFFYIFFCDLLIWFYRLLWVSFWFIGFNLGLLVVFGVLSFLLGFKFFRGFSRFFWVALIVFIWLIRFSSGSGLFYWVYVIIIVAYWVY